VRKGVGRLIELPALRAGESVTDQICRHLRRLMAEGAISPGVRLPAQRLLARDLKVSRNTIASALDRLTSEDLIETRTGAGTFVKAPARGVACPPAFAAAHLPKAAPAPVAPFETGAAGHQFFPVTTWMKLQAEVWRKLDRAQLSQHWTGGWPGLRTIMAQRLAATRSFLCAPDQVHIVSSRAEGLALCARALAGHVAGAWVESMGGRESAQVLSAHGLKVTGVAVDRFGVKVEALQKGSQEQALGVVTPACHQFTGVAMAPARRRALLEWAHVSKSWIVEDDDGADFSPGSRLNRPLAAEAQGDRVIYMTSLNGVLHAQVRVACVVVPRPLLERFSAMRADLAFGPDAPHQMVLEEFMERGYLAAHVRQMRVVYALRREAVIAGLRRLGLWTQALRAAVAGGNGLQFMIPVGSKETETAVIAEALHRGVKISALSASNLQNGGPWGLVLGYALHEPNRIWDALQRVAPVLADLRE
jgi:GntR family transcriptional regulator / MocR family aminotransferase